MESQIIANYRCSIGEGPLWHPLEEQLYWTDIDAGRMFRYDPKTGHHEQFYKGPSVGGFTIQSDGSLVLFMAKGTIKILKDNKLTTIVKEIPEVKEGRFNDVIVDPCGRIFCGTLDYSYSSGLGYLYRLDTDGSFTRILDGLGISNGLGFSLDRKTMYHTDSTAMRIYSFEYDERTGSITNQKVFIDRSEKSGTPDGMTVDSMGHIWSATLGIGIIRYDSDGKEEKVISLSTQAVLSVTFGGSDYSDMYVTSGQLDGIDLPGVLIGEDAGSLYKLDPEVKGIPEFLSRINI